MGDRGNRNRKGVWRWIGGLGALIASGLKLVPSFLKLGKFGGTLLSMVLSVGAYTAVLRFPWSFSIGLVIMIFIHEMGHIWAAKRKGLPVSAPAFIPFVGALITLKRQPRDAVTEAYVAFGGPILGTLGALAAWLLAGWTGYQVLYPIAYIGFFLNLLNLLPMHPLDGGRIVTAISRWLWVVGLILGLVLILVLWSPLLLLIWLLFAFQLWTSYLSRRRNNERRLKTTVEVDPSKFIGVSLPEKEERRVLPFVQYCDINDREHRCVVYFPQAGEIHRYEGFRGGFREVRLIGTEVKMAKGGPRIRMTLEADYIRGAEERMLRTDREYYAVSLWTRLGYGFVYIGLASFLVYMLWTAGNLSLMGHSVS
ncbi:hypothetical protein C8P63_1189 [Melghirimyces profundicolus]|uniref:Peptidase M50 domain-containing protein n=1 Tax=Melghirimyces profundicolus TaxID=1242148 RepID=A0A2T6BPW8_9BACL|nr:site-2 protease family protein [Melghirimyces profundicolus]PTX58135.1 hypothetical protein C8P63_1189 [Melghirimyces profundicolus]